MSRQLLSMRGSKMNVILLAWMLSGVAAGDEGKVASAMMQVLQDFGQIILTIIALIIIILTRHIWYPTVHAMTCAHFHPTNPLDITICGCSPVGWCTMNLCCPCICPPYHTPFRLRVIVHHAKGLR
eukprot:GEMP01083851.1.p2 GENE.GEMP01083851.1~~GEMP01083851.1.p2  ORF type:complete len:126 (+),score=12.89 GEMP01083851.1:98-475(+)